MNHYLSKVLAILYKDVMVELRTKETIAAMFLFAVLVTVIFNFAMELRSDNAEMVTSGVLWVAITFAGMLGLSRSFIAEKDKGSMDALLLCPMDRSALYLGKMLVNLVFMTAMEVIVLPVSTVLFGFSLLTPRLLLVVALGTLGFAAVGTLFSAIAVNTKTREIMLPILFFPIVIPVIIAAVKATELILQGRPTDTFLPWVNLMLAFDVVFLTVSLLTFEFVVEE